MQNGTHHLQFIRTIYVPFSRLATFFLFRRACRRPRFARVTHASERPKYNDHIVIALRFAESSGSQRRLHSAPATTRNYSATTYDGVKQCRRLPCRIHGVPCSSNSSSRYRVLRTRRFYWFRGNRTSRREIEREIKL